MRTQNLRNRKQLISGDRSWARNPYTGSGVLLVTPALGCLIKTIPGFFLDPNLNMYSPLISLPTCPESGKHVATSLRKLRLTKVLALPGPSVKLGFWTRSVPHPITAVPAHSSCEERCTLDGRSGVCPPRKGAFIANKDLGTPVHTPIPSESGLFHHGVLTIKFLDIQG